MKTGAYFRILIIAIVAFFLIENVSGTEAGWAMLENPVLIAVWAVIVFFMIAIEVSVASLKRLLFHTLNDEAKARYLEKENVKKDNQFAWVYKIYKLFIGKKKARTEAEIVLDHNYDGIRELDNNLPPWWVYSFYLTIIFAVVYMLRYHVFDGPTQEEEYQREVAAAVIAIEEYKKTAKNLVDASTVEVLTDAADLQVGKSIFNDKCMVCHRADGGGGIGPNLTDPYWILGGSISDVFQVIAEGGRPGKGMVAWKNDLKPLEIAQVASYILSLQGTNPPDPKAPEGDLYETAEIAEEATTVEE